MAKTEHYYTKFEEDKFYHIYNRTVDRKPMFRNEGNFEFFLKRFDKLELNFIQFMNICRKITVSIF